MGLIMLTRQRNKSQVLLIASPFSREGKTTVAYNLALGLAEKGPTCFVDADLRKPNDGDVGGLFAHYRDAATAEELEAPSGDSGNLTCVSSGTGPENPISVLISDKFRRFTSAIRSRYEFVVIDSPPLLPYADGRFLAALADGAVLVGYAGLTARKSLVSAAEILAQQAVPILGVVLNGVRAVEIPYRGY
jgi:capsular exopolysaccharide synthesis family protein